VVGGGGEGICQGISISFQLHNGG